MAAEQWTVVRSTRRWWDQSRLNLWKEDRREVEAKVEAEVEAEA